MKTFSKDLKQHATEIMVMVPLTNKPNKSDCKQKICYICRKKSFIDDNGSELYLKVQDHCYYTDKYRAGAHNICNLRYKATK